MQFQTVTGVAHEVFVTSQKGKAREVSRFLSKPYASLMRELNPYDKAAKLGADDLLRLMQQTGEIAPLRFMARSLGYKLVKAPEAMDLLDDTVFTPDPCEVA